MTDWNGDTHCPYCEKPIADDAQYDEENRIEQEFGACSAEWQAYADQFCWDYPNFQCHNYAKDENELETSDRRIRELLTERDALRQAMQELAELNYNMAQSGPNARYVYDLKQEVARLQAKVRELEDIPTCPVCGEPMTRRNADGTLGCNLCYALDGDA